MIKNFLNPEGHQNLISGSKVTAILLKGWILPICGVAWGRVCVCSLCSRLVSMAVHIKAASTVSYKKHNIVYCYFYSHISVIHGSLPHFCKVFNGRFLAKVFSTMKTKILLFLVIFSLPWSHLDFFPQEYRKNRVDLLLLFELMLKNASFLLFKILIGLS